MAENKVYKWLESASGRLGIVCRNEADAERCAEILQPFLEDNLDRGNFQEYARQGYGYVRIGGRTADGIYDFRTGSSEALIREFGAAPIEFEDFLREISEEPIALSDYLM